MEHGGAVGYVFHRAVKALKLIRTDGHIVVCGLAAAVHRNGAILCKGVGIQQLPNIILARVFRNPGKLGPLPGFQGEDAICIGGSSADLFIAAVVNIIRSSGSNKQVPRLVSIL